MLQYCGTFDRNTRRALPGNDIWYYIIALQQYSILCSISACVPLLRLLYSRVSLIA